MYTCTRPPCREAIVTLSRPTKIEDHYSTPMSWQNSFQVACSSNEVFMKLPEEDQERFWLITDALMMNDLEDLKRVHNLANYLMVRRIKIIQKWRRHSMDYKKEIENFLNEIQSEKFLNFLYNVIVSFKKQWGT